MNDNFTVLLVEDSPIMRSLIADMLRQADVGMVIEARDGRGALEALERETVHLVLSDWNMRPMNGMHLLQAMRAIPAKANIPFIMMTGEPSPTTISQAVAAGVAGFLPKPFGREQLLQIVTQIKAEAMQAA
jgi:two-component system chemotaxis response regulator CheY